MFGETFKLKEGRSISFCDFGKKNSVATFQFHGTPGSRITGLTEEMVAESGFRIVLPDRPGYGHSTSCRLSSFESWAHDIGQLADHLGIHQFHVLGVSGGGPFALACAAYLQGRVLSATLVSTATPAESSAFWQGMGIANKIFFLTAMKHPRVLRVLCDLYGRVVRWGAALMGSEPSHGSEAFRQGGAGLESDLRVISHPWNIPLHTVTAPVFIWHGEKDVHSPVAGVKLLASQIPTCETCLFPDQNHFLHRDRAINQKIEDRIRTMTVPNESSHVTRAKNRADQ